MKVDHISVPVQLVEQVSRHEIPPTSLAVYCLLLIRQYDSPKTQEGLASDLGISVSGFRRHLALLKHRGWISTSRANILHGNAIYGILNRS